MTKNLLFAAATLMLSSLSASAAKPSLYPAAKENYVNDFAGVLKENDVVTLRQKLAALEQMSGVEGTVVTVKSIADYQTNAMTVDAFATGLFNAWGIGNKPRNDGFMVLVSVGDRKTRIELGDGWGTAYNERMKSIVDEQMVPRFRDAEYSRGIYDGTLAVMDALTRKVPFWEAYWKHVLGAAGVLVLVLIGMSLIKNGQTGWGWAFLAAAAALLFFLLKMLSSGKRSGSGGGFGGGSSSGRGGASGSW